MKGSEGFYYIIHRENLKSILENGILSHCLADKFLPKKQVIYDEEIIQRRKEKKIKDLSLQHYVNLFFQARNPMLYRVIKDFGRENIIVLKINADIINSPGATGVVEGNAAKQNAPLFDNIEQGLSSLDDKLFNIESSKKLWDNEIDKNKLMSELFVYAHIPRKKIIEIIAPDALAASYIKQEICLWLNITSDPDMFFSPEHQWKAA